MEVHEVEEWFSLYAVKRRSGYVAPLDPGQDLLLNKGWVLLDHGPEKDAGEGRGLQERLWWMFSAGTRVLVHAFTASFPSHMCCLTSLSTAVQFLPFHRGVVVHAVFKCRLPGMETLHLILAGA